MSIDPAGATGTTIMQSMLWTVGLVNAFNLMDNLDGVRGTLGCVVGRARLSRACRS